MARRTIAVVSGFLLSQVLALGVMALSVVHTTDAQAQTAGSAEWLAQRRARFAAWQATNPDVPGQLQELSKREQALIAADAGNAASTGAADPYAEL